MSTELATFSPADELDLLDPVLRASMEQLVDDGINANTERTYTGLYRRFDEWCDERGLTSHPVSDAALMGYLTHLSDKRVQPSTLRHVVSVIGSREKAAGGALSGTLMAAAETAIKGHVQRRQYDQQSKAHPLVPDRIRSVSCELDYGTIVGLRAGLILSLGYSGACRTAELANFRIGDVVPTPNGLKLTFWTSKTDQAGRGEVRPIPAGDFVRTDPVTRLREYLEALASLGVDITDPTLPLLRSITKHGTVRRLQPGKVALREQNIGLIIRDACRIGGLPQWQSVSGHSLRAGFATASAFKQEPQIPLSAWAYHGRWALTSRTPMLYVRDSEAVNGNPLNHVSV